MQNKPHREVIERTSDSSESPYLIVPHPSGPPEADISTAESPANGLNRNKRRIFCYPSPLCSYGFSDATV